MYSIHGYGLMLADPRADAYALALRQVVAPGAVVVDLGSGPGIWALYACSLGARRVFAIEPDDVINLGIQAARANGFDDRITFIQHDSRDVSLDEPADVVVADVRDVLPLSAAGLSTMIDSRRFLSPGGTIVPARDTLWVAVVHAPAAHHATVGPWDERCFGLDFTAARRAAVSLPRKERFGPDDLVAPPAAWAALDYRTLASPAVAGSVRLSAARSGLAHGLAVWFESELVDGVRLSNRPGDPPLLYGQSFLPWPAPVALEAGDAIDLELRAAPAGETSVLVWNTRAIHASSGREFARFAQSTFDGLPLSVSSLRARPEAGEA